MAFRFTSYYWTLIKHLGRCVWDTRGRELISALLLAVVTFFVSYVFKQADALTAFEIAVVSLLGWFALFALWHLMHSPIALHSREAHDKAQRQHWGFGVLGIAAVAVIVGNLAAAGLWWWTAREPKITLPSADSGALHAIVEQQMQEIKFLQSRIPDETSLKVRLSRAADEYEDFWRKYPKGPTCNQDSKMTPEQQRKVIEPCTIYFAKREADYQRLFAPRVMEIVSEVKGKGIDVTNIENCAAAGYCGIPLSVQLRAFSLRLDAHDNVKGLGCISVSPS